MINLTYFAACSGGDFLGFPKWYKYLHGATDPTTHLCTPTLTSLNDVWLIVAAVIELLLRVAACLAVALVLYGGIQYIISQGEPDRTNKARQTIVSALGGLVVAIISAAVVAFIAGRFS